MLYRAKAGTPWRDLPERYRNWKTGYSRWLLRWDAGVWQKVWEALQAEVEGAAPVDGAAEWQVWWYVTLLLARHFSRIDSECSAGAG